MYAVCSCARDCHRAAASELVVTSHRPSRLNAALLTAAV
jgi:hypothetical protein